ncbi:MAG: DUF1292 domain-containing protein [Clostridia bacterium]|nr:DUF1292 domain-containing protein [Clostridia bacterium]
MAEQEKNLPEEEEEVDVFTLTDEEGNEEQFEVLGSIELDGKVYYALTSVEGQNDEYVILRLEGEEGDEVTLVTVDDDDEFDRVADEFEDKLFGEIDYDADEQ